MNIEKGEIIAFNNKEYICLNKISEEDKDYLCLLGNFKPAEVKFAIINTKSNDSKIEVVNNPEQKQKILKLFQSTIR